MYSMCSHLHAVSTRSRTGGKLITPQIPKGSGAKSKQLAVHVTAKGNKRDLKTKGIYMYEQVHVL